MTDYTEMTRDTTRTETTHAEHTGSTDTETLGDVSHTNPYTDEAFGSTQVYDRGKVVAADGGADPAREDAGATDGDGDAAADGGRRGDDERLEDVDHTPPRDAESANRVYERGHEGKDETV